MCGVVQSEGAFDEGNARIRCSESSTSTKKVKSGAIRKARATSALARDKYLHFSIWLF